MQDGSKLVHYQSKGNWSDNFNNYGKFKCKGSLLINESGKRSDKELVLCELEDVKGEYMWNIPKRSDSEWEAGVGKTEIAKVLSESLGRNLIRLQCYEGLDISSAVYEWNYSRQMIDIRISEASGDRDKKEIENDIFSEEFLIKKKL